MGSVPNSWKWGRTSTVRQRKRFAPHFTVQPHFLELGTDPLANEVSGPLAH